MRKIAILIITLMMIGTGLLSGCTQIPVEIKNNPPTASCTANPISGTAPLTVYFIGSGNDSDGNITSYYWDFGDGSTSNLQNPSHMFTNDGDYTVTFTVRDNKGSPGIDTVQIHVTKPTNQPPVASLSANRTGGTIPAAVSFTGSGTDTDGYITSYFWNFGDGSSSNQQSPSHTFANAGTYNVTLTVTDNNGTTDTRSKTIKCYPVSDWTQSGINYICQKYGDSSNCVVSSGLIYDVVDALGETHTNQTGATADIVALILFNMIKSITMTTPSRPIITGPNYALLTANNGGLDAGDAQTITQHDENSGDQWCYSPTTKWTRNGINYICETYGDENNCIKLSGLQFNYVDIHGDTGTLTGGTGDIIWLIVQDTVTEITNSRGQKITNPKAALDAQNGFEVTSSMAFEIDQHSENSTNPWCYCSNC